MKKKNQLLLEIATFASRTETKILSFKTRVYNITKKKKKEYWKKNKKLKIAQWQFNNWQDLYHLLERA